MKDKKPKKQDRLRVAGQDPSEFRYLRKQFPGCTRQQVAGAIRAAGPMRRNIIRYLRLRQQHNSFHKLRCTTRQILLWLARDLEKQRRKR